MRWLKGQRKANAALYVEGENNNMMLANPTGLAGKLVKVVSRDPEVVRAYVEDPLVYHGKLPVRTVAGTGRPVRYGPRGLTSVTRLTLGRPAAPPVGRCG